MPLLGNEDQAGVFENRVVETTNATGQPRAILHDPFSDKYFDSLTDETVLDIPASRFDALAVILRVLMVFLVYGVVRMYLLW